MARVKRGSKKRRRRKKILKDAKGYRGVGNRLYKLANERLLKALWYAYRDRRQRKRDFRRLWITRINAAARQHGLSYSRFIHGLKQANIEINRKMLADLAVNDEEAFQALVEEARVHLNEAG